jgi:hypothetical protein
MPPIYETSSKSNPSISLTAAIAVLFLPVSGTVAMYLVSTQAFFPGLIYILWSVPALVTTGCLYFKRSDAARKVTKAFFDVLLSVWGVAAIAMTFANVYALPADKIEMTTVLAQAGPGWTAVGFGVMLGAAFGRLAIAAVDIFEGALKLRAGSTPA